MSSKEITRKPWTADIIERWTIGAARTGESREVLGQRKPENSPRPPEEGRAPTANNQSWRSSRWSLSFLWNQTPCYAPPRPLDISSDNSTLSSNWTRWNGNHSSEDKNKVLDHKSSWFDQVCKDFWCVCCREIEARTKTQLMADLPRTHPHLEPFMPPFH